MIQDLIQFIQRIKRANKILKTITREDVKKILSKQKRRQNDYRGYNSYVANQPLQELQIDLGIFTESADDNNGFKYRFVGIDVFRKYCHAVPIKDKRPEEATRALKEVLEK